MCVCVGGGGGNISGYSLLCTSRGSGGHSYSPRNILVFVCSEIVFGTIKFCFIDLYMSLVSSYTD